MRSKRALIVMTTAAATVLLASGLTRAYQTLAPPTPENRDVIITQPIHGNDRYVQGFYKQDSPFLVTSVRPLGNEETSLNRQADGLAQELASADSDSKRSAIKTKLSELLGKQFDARQKRHKQEIEALETQVKKLRELVNKRQESRDEIIARRLEQVLRDSQGLGW